MNLLAQLKLRGLIVGTLIGVFNILLQGAADAQSLSSSLYQIGEPVVVDYFVDPVLGSDENSGLGANSPRRTVTSIWEDIPTGTQLTTGIRINLANGSYGSDHLPNYWENREGTASAPIILRAKDGYGGVFFTRDLNMAGVSYFYLIGVDIKNRVSDGYGDAFHCERCDHILLRGSSFNGAPSGLNSSEATAHETIKFNQSQYVFIENNNIQGADDNAIDWVAVQYGHIRGNRIHNAAGWCTYVKGGSSYILIEGNRVHDCGEGGITAGQGTGLEFMVTPFTRYEANYVKIVNNVIYDTIGAALGVNGGYGVLIANNTAYRVGERSHLIEVVFGERSCDGDTTACAERRGSGGWGPALTGYENSQPIGNRDVVIANNVVYNPPGYTSGSQHFAIYGPRAPTTNGIPTPQRSDSELKIIGNLIWNGESSMPLGIEGESDGCRDDNPTCNVSQLLAANRVNTTQPQFTDLTSGDFRPLAGSVLAGLNGVQIPEHLAIDSTNNPIPEGERSNTLEREFSGALVNPSSRPPGAFAGAESSNRFAGEDEIATPNEGENTPPEISILKLLAKRAGKRVKLNVEVRVNDTDGVNGVDATVLGSRRSLPFHNNRYSRSLKIPYRKRYRVVVRATDIHGASTIVSQNVRTR